MNHWQLVIQDIWSVARYAMPVGAMAVFAFYWAKSDELDFGDRQMLNIATAAFLVTTWLCMAGYL